MSRDRVMLKVSLVTFRCHLVRTRSLIDCLANILKLAISLTIKQDGVLPLRVKLTIWDMLSKIHATARGEATTPDARRGEFRLTRIDSQVVFDPFVWFDLLSSQDVQQGYPI